ncbi:MAG: hypothetical protein JNM07_01335 [Phycisphaerae bacterium]|nr:hypothetical protein [Phycisphaerae bacterium]
MPSVRIEHERESGRGWTYDVLVERPDAPPTRHQVGLSFADYEHWSHGVTRPEEVMRALVLCALRTGRFAPGGLLPPRFDAATVRRYVPDLDRHMQRAE